MQREKNINLHWNIGNAFVRYVGSNIKHKSKVSYKRVRIVEISLSGEKVLLFTIQSFIKDSLAIAMKGNVSYEFKSNEWRKLAKASGIISGVMVSDKEVFIRAKFGHEKQIDPENSYIDRYEIDTVFPSNSALISLIQRYEIKFSDFRITLN